MLSFLLCRPTVASAGVGHQVPGHFGFALLLILLMLGPAAPAATTPVDSLRALLRQRALPDTQRVTVLEQLCRHYGAPGTNPDTMLHYGQQAVMRARRLPDPKHLLAALNTLGTAYGRSHRMPEALAVFLEQLRKAQQHQSPRFQSLAELALGNIYSEQKDLRQAEYYFRAAVVSARQVASPVTLAKAESFLGDFLQGLQRYAEAEPHMRRALATYDSLGLRDEQAYTLSYLAEGEYRQKRYTAALQHAQQSLSLLPPDDRYAQACLYDLLNRSFAGLGQLPQAITHGNKAVALARAAQTPETEMELLDNLIESYARHGDHAAIYPLHQRSVMLHDSVFRQNQATEVDRLLAQFGAEKKQHAIRTLTQQNRIQQLQVDRQRIRIRLLAVGAVALALALGLFGVLYWQLSRSRRQLAASEGALRRLNRTKDLLMSIIGHDLRGPLAAFQQVAHILRVYARKPDPTALTELADEVEAGANRAGVLLDNLLHWSRAQANDVANHPEALSSEALVTEVVGLYRPAALTKQLQLVTNLPPDLPPIWADPTLLATVLRNLISNAVKFTPAGGTVTITVEPATEPAGDYLTFSVSDTGIGMAAHRLATLFEAGQERSTRGTAGEPGTGLGLAVCQAFVTLLGGQLRVTSTEGTGTHFSFELPVAPIPAAAPDPTSADRRVSA